MGPSCGRSMPAGNSTVCSRSVISCRARKMLVLSSNVTTTCDRLNLETERTFTRPGRPLTASSTGLVTCCSASCGLSDGTVVLICTWTGVVSGKASIGRRVSARPPTSRSAAASTQTSRRFFSKLVISQFNIRLRCSEHLSEHLSVCWLHAPNTVCRRLSRRWAPPKASKPK